MLSNSFLVYLVVWSWAAWWDPQSHKSLSESVQWQRRAASTSQDRPILLKSHCENTESGAKSSFTFPSITPNNRPESPSCWPVKVPFDSTEGTMLPALVTQLYFQLCCTICQTGAVVSTASDVTGLKPLKSDSDGFSLQNSAVFLRAETKQRGTLPKRVQWLKKSLNILLTYRLHGKKMSFLQLWKCVDLRD